MNIEVDVYKALEALLLQECSGDAIVDDDDDEKTFASKNVSVSRVRLAMKLSEEKTTLRNTCVVVVKYGRSFESKVHLASEVAVVCAARQKPLLAQSEPRATYS